MGLSGEMKRRDFITLLGGATVAAAGPRLARAQQAGAARQVGVLMTYAADDPEALLRVHALERRLGELGWTDDNLTIDYRWASGGDPKLLQAQAAQLAASRPDVIICQSTPVLMALRQESKTTPIVFVQVTDPVGSGFVPNLARPGGRMTGFTDFEYDIAGKWIELLEDIAPKVSAVTVVAMAGHAGNAGMFRVMEKVGPSRGVRVTKAELDEASKIERDVVTDSAGGGLIVLPSPAAIAHREALVALATERHLPACFPLRYFAASGGLMSYGIDQVDEWGRAAAYVNRILRGEKPGDLPVQQPSKFELVVNMKTARSLGLDVPMALIASADEIIQ